MTHNLIRAITTMGLSQLEEAAVKATYPDDNPPKLKHVENLISSCGDYDLLPYFMKRLHGTGKWNIALKTLIVIHRCMNEGNDRFLRLLSRQSNILSMNNFFDTNAKATPHLKFIKYYAEYLAEKLYVYRALQLLIEKKTPTECKNWSLSLNSNQLSVYLPILEEQFSKLLLIAPFSQEDLDHSIPLTAMQYLIKDAFRLYSVITVGMLAVLDKYSSMTLKELNHSLKAAERFLIQNENFKKWTEKIARMGLIDRKMLPNFDSIPPTFIEIIKEEINKKIKKGEVEVDSDDETQEENKIRKKIKKRGKGEIKNDDDDNDEDDKIIAATAAAAAAKESNKGKKAVDEDDDQEQEEEEKEKKKKKKSKKTKEEKKNNDDDEEEAEEDEGKKKKKKKKKKKQSTEDEEEDDNTTNTTNNDDDDKEDSDDEQVHAARLAKMRAAEEAARKKKAEEDAAAAAAVAKAKAAAEAEEKKKAAAAAAAAAAEAEAKKKKKKKQQKEESEEEEEEEEESEEETKKKKKKKSKKKAESEEEEEEEESEEEDKKKKKKKSEKRREKKKKR